ncbi:hypothetical protein, partial [Desulfotomaculum copahuensis]|uniref:hypothetical protein n=1 Tax=Desulfotomaculum copahuensis TaxID=1838280 RepID=UPI001A9A59BB
EEVFINSKMSSLLAFNGIPTPTPTHAKYKQDQDQKKDEGTVELSGFHSFYLLIRNSNSIV